MPFTLLFARLLGALVLVLLGASAMRAPDAVVMAATALIWVALDDAGAS